MSTEQHSVSEQLAGVIQQNAPALAERFRSLFRHFAGRHQGATEIELLNRFWRTQLGLLNVNTIPEREWLVNDVDGPTWVQFFANNILPTVIREELPRPLS